jgi:hypothetical protein
VELMIAVPPNPAALASQAAIGTAGRWVSVGSGSPAP